MVLKQNQIILLVDLKNVIMPKKSIALILKKMFQIINSEYQLRFKRIFMNDFKDLFDRKRKYPSSYSCRQF